jgi:hypothetical protein
VGLAASILREKVSLPHHIPENGNLHSRYRENSISFDELCTDIIYAVFIQDWKGIKVGAP